MYHLNKNRKPDIAIHADPTRIMHEIGKIINPPSCQEWIKELSVLEESREKEIQQFSETKSLRGLIQILALSKISIVLTII